MLLRHASALIGLMIGSLAVLTGCLSNTKMLEDGRLSYNEAIRSSTAKELLLNIVRVRYLDNFQFLTADSISAQIAFGLSIGGRAGLERGESTALSIGEANWSDRPTFTFTPSRGREFAETMTTPVSIVQLNDLLGKELRLDMVMRLLVKSINGLQNSAGKITPQFIELSQLMQQAHEQADLVFGTVRYSQNISAPIQASRVSGRDVLDAAKQGYRFTKEDSGRGLVLTQTIVRPAFYIDKAATQRPRIFELLGLPESHPDKVELRPLSQTPKPQKKTRHAQVETASVIEVIAYLASGVDVPDVDLDLGLTTREWPPMTEQLGGLDGLFTVHSAAEKPTASLAVKFRDTWYYLADDDVISRQTFRTVSSFLNVTLQSSSGREPVLTLPVGQ